MDSRSKLKVRMWELLSVITEEAPTNTIVYKAIKMVKSPYAKIRLQLYDCSSMKDVPITNRWIMCLIIQELENEIIQLQEEFIEVVNDEIGL
jgi:predicted mannosyl-3-phosphoglycerate phosphatase (HAD superfamily)